MKKVSFVLRRIMKSRILERAAILFNQRGIRGVTMDEVANDLAISKKTLYHYFSDKDDLVLHIVDAHICHTIEQYNTFSKKAKDAVEEMILNLEFLNNYFSNRNPSVFHDLQKYHFSSWQRFLAYKNNFLKKTIQDNLKRGVKEGYFRKDIDLEIVSMLRLEQVENVFDNRLFPSERFKLPKLNEQSMKLYMYGITTLEGHKLINKYLSQITRKK